MKNLKVLGIAIVGSLLLSVNVYAETPSNSGQSQKELNVHAGVTSSLLDIVSEAQVDVNKKEQKYSIGYGQNTRYQIFNAFKKYGKIKNIKENVNGDCSETVRTCLAEIGIEVKDFTTWNEVDALLSTGAFEKTFIVTDPSQLQTGDVLVTRSKGHTAIVTKGVNILSKVIKKNPYRLSQRVIKRNDKGESVKWLQWQLNKKNKSNLTIDGVFGGNTEKAVKSFQRKKKLTVDGIVGANTLKKLK